MFPLIFLCNCLGILVGNLLLFYTSARLVEPKRPRLYVWAASFLGLAIWTLNNYLLPNPSPLLDAFTVVFAVVSSFCVSPRGQKWQGAVATLGLAVLTIAIMFVVSLVAFPVAEKLQIPAQVLTDTKGSFGNAMMSFLCQPIFALVCFFYYRLVKNRLPRMRLSPTLLFLLLIPISQGLLMNIINRFLSYGISIGGIKQLYGLAVLLSVAADVGFAFGMRKIQQIEELRQQVRRANEQLEVQMGYYRQLQESILTVNQIRHDLNNQLQAAYHLMDSGQTELARQQLNQLQRDVGPRVGPRFTSNLLVDAVLSDKARLCREAGIALTISTEVPAELPIESTHLCSIFSNLLDNSIQGVLNSDGAQKIIELQASVRGNCLMIRCANPAKKPLRNQRHDPLRTHGLGLGILNTIASKYNGTLNTEYRDGSFRTDLCIPLPEKTEGEMAHVQ